VTTSLQHNAVFAEGARLLRGAFQLDHSTSVSDLGTLFEHEGHRPLQQLKRQLAQAYGAAWSFPSTHGTSMLNILALLTACPAGGRVLVNRDAHSSVTAALVHGGYEPVYLPANYDPALGLCLGPTLASFEALLAREAVDCVFLTSPNYFGIVGELGEIIAAAHAQGLAVVVDAAHAPHFHFCPLLPPAAEDLGADFITQSTHKVATALSQGSLLLLRRAADVPALYEQVNELGLVSTSFSYPILASVELGVRQLLDEGDLLWRQALARAETLRTHCAALPGVHVLEQRDAVRPGLVALDRTRVTLDVAATGLTGFEVERRLHARRVYPEMATAQHVLFLVTPGTCDADVAALFDALQDGLCDAPAGPRLAIPPPPPLPDRVLLPREARFARKEIVPVREATGRIAGETIAAYPPGVPIVTAGERLQAEVLDYLHFMRACGATLKGAADPELRTVKVI